MEMLPLVAAKLAAAIDTTSDSSSEQAAEVTHYDTLQVILNTELYFKVHRVLYIDLWEGVLSSYIFVDPAVATMI